MITDSFLKWLGYKWRGEDPSLLQAYQVTFNGPHGARVLQHLLDTVYCTVLEDPSGDRAIAHNARRALVHEIIMNIDSAEHPGKYEVKVQEIEDGSLAR